MFKVMVTKRLAQDYGDCADPAYEVDRFDTFEEASEIAESARQAYPYGDAWVEDLDGNVRDEMEPDDEWGEFDEEWDMELEQEREEEWEGEL